MATLNDFLVECEIFPYSEENYNLIKEAHELNIADLYLRNQRYMQENAEFLKTQAEGVMMEAADPETNKNVEESVKTKSKNWKEKAKKIWKKIVTAFTTFWKAIVKRWEKIFGKANELEKDMQAVTDPDKLDVDAISSLVDKAMKDSDNVINLDKGSIGKLPKTFKKAIPDDKKNIKQALAIALYHKTIDCLISSEKYKMALSNKQLKEFLNDISDKAFLVADKEALAKVTKRLDGYASHNLKNGVKVTGNIEDLNSLITNTKDALNKISEPLENIIKNYGYYSDSYSVGDINPLFTDASKVSADTIKLYTNVIRFKETMLNGLRPIVNKAKKSSESKKSDD